MATKIYNYNENIKIAMTMTATDVFLDRSERSKSISILRKLNRAYLFSIHRWTENDKNRIWFHLGLKIKSPSNSNDYISGVLNGYLEAVKHFI